MGEPHPNLKFDHGAANDAITQLNAVVTVLKSQTTARQTKAKTMGPPNWTGPYSDQFYNTELPRMTKEAGTLVGQLQALITQINNASNTANQYARENSTWHNQNDPKPNPQPQAPPAPPR